MRFVIKRISDNSYLMVLKMALLENCQWTMNINEAKVMTSGLSQNFVRRFTSEEFEIISID